MNVIFTDHAQIRIKQRRQRNFSKQTVIDYVQTIPGFNTFPISVTNHKFKVVFRDDERGNRVIITIIGYVH